MNAVLVVNANARFSIASWEDLFNDGQVKLAIASEGAAVRELTRKHLDKGKWDRLVAHSSSLGTVTDVANALKLGVAANAGIIWDNLLASPHFSMLQTVKLTELDGLVATVKIAVVKGSSRPGEALAFAQFVSGGCADIFRRHGFTSVSKTWAIGWEVKP
jgi:ABC-type molybdate transport system substrate-binding protein